MENAPVVRNSIVARDGLMQLVSFTIEQEEYGVDVLNVREIIRVPAITHIPTAPCHVEGIFSLRGSVIPVISMRERFGIGCEGDSGRTRVIVMTVGETLMGFKVDAVTEVLRIAGSEVQPPPSLATSGIDQQCITGVVKREKRLLIMLDPGRLFSATEKELIGNI